MPELAKEARNRLRLYSDVGELRQWYGPDGTANDAHTAARKDVDAALRHIDALEARVAVLEAALYPLVTEGVGHLVLARHEGQGVLIGDSVAVRVIRKTLPGGKLCVQLSIVAPDHVKITRIERLKDPSKAPDRRPADELSPRRRRARIA